MILYPKMKKETLVGMDGSCQISERHRKAVERCLSLILEENQKKKLQIERIILFGSCARGESRYESDIDLLLLVKEVPEGKEIRKLKMKLGDIIAPEVDVKISTSNSFENSSDFFMSRIKKDGVTLWKC